jgi:hypothetical protein
MDAPADRGAIDGNSACRSYEPPRAGGMNNELLKPADQGFRLT